ncbi:MAG: reverse transcriptase-like protein [Armatimonadota bacterium]
MVSIYNIYIDGASRGNPGHASIGVVVKNKDGDVIKQVSQYIGFATNNQAEYKALIKALEVLKGTRGRITVYTDSQLLERQWNKQYKVKNEDILKLYKHALNLVGGMDIKIISIPREKNKEADSLANKALDNYERTVPLSSSSAKSKITKERYSQEFIEEEPDSPEVKNQASAGGVVYKISGSKIKVLLISKKRGYVWALPKGRIEKNEDEKETARREIAEETGFECEVKEKIDEVQYSFLLKEENIFYNKRVVFYLMPVMSENQKERDHEADEVKWFMIGDAVKKLTFLSEKKVLEKAKSLLV